jgi:hypothetical protein
MWHSDNPIVNNGFHRFTRCCIELDKYSVTFTLGFNVASIIINTECKMQRLTLCMMIKGLAKWSTDVVYITSTCMFCVYSNYAIYTVQLFCHQ